VSEKRELRTIFGPKTEEVIRRWIKLQNEELRNMCSSQNNIKVIILRIMRWMGQVARMGNVTTNSMVQDIL